jgi:hypothetical protein
MQCIRGRCGWLSDEDELGRLFFLYCPLAVRLSLCILISLRDTVLAAEIPSRSCPPPSSVSIGSTPSHATPQIAYLHT